MQAGRYTRRALPTAAVAAILIVAPSLAATDHHHSRLANAGPARHLLRTATVQQLAEQVDPKGGWISSDDLLSRRTWKLRDCARLRWSKATVCEASLRVYRRTGGAVDTHVLIQIADGAAQFLTPTS